jgi:general secretion pathway protein G
MHRTDTCIPSNGGTPQAAQRRVRGFTLLELMLAGAIVALLFAVAIPGYQTLIERQRVGQAVRDLSELAMRIEKYRTVHDLQLPDSLAVLGAEAPLTDPWGYGYQYLNFGSGAKGIQGMIRKDHNLHPLNTEFDLYSIGRDGKTMPPLTGKASRDDVVWARDGAFIGLARDY